MASRAEWLRFDFQPTTQPTECDVLGDLRVLRQFPQSYKSFDTVEVRSSSLLVPTIPFKRLAFPTPADKAPNGSIRPHDDETTSRREDVRPGFSANRPQPPVASGDFAQAYLLAHEIGHHVQNLLGIENKVRQVQRSHPDLVNKLSVQLELQADCLAGVWGHSTDQRQILETGDVDKALNAAAAIGDDRLQRMAGQGVHPDSFTHGSSAERVRWFQAGFASGDVAACNTFGQ